MKTSSYIIFLVFALFYSCSDDLSFEEETIDAELIAAENQITTTENFVNSSDPIDYSAIFFSTVSDPQQLPEAVIRSVQTLYPDVRIQSFQKFDSKVGTDYVHYSVFLHQGIEAVFYQNGFPLTSATIEDQFDTDELLAGQMSWWQLLRVEESYRGDLIEEVKMQEEGKVRVDFKDRQSVVINKMGMAISTSTDDTFDDLSFILIDPVDLPQAIKDYISTNYPSDTIIEAEENLDGYEVIISSGIKLEFDISGNFIEISGNGDDDGENQGEDINPADLPQAILDYIATNYPDLTIVEAEIYPNQYEVTLSSGVELEFDLSGNFLEVSGQGGDDNGDDNEIETGSLPAAVTDYIAANYPGETIVKAEFDGIEYEVTLSNGLKLEFDDMGNFKEISGNDGDDSGEEDEIEISNLPMPVTDYISANYPGETIVKAEFDGVEYEVTLSNGLKLEFDSMGSFKEISGSEGEGENEDDHISVGDLPMSVTDYVAANYPGETIIKAEFDGVEYEVTLSGGLKLEFDADGNFREISGNSGDGEGEGEDINIEDLPQVIIDYISTNYPAAVIIDAESDEDGFEIELSNGVELEFDNMGNLIEVDGDGSGSDDDCSDITFGELPAAAQNYINTNYDGIGIDRVRSCTDEYRVELDNDVKITFDLDGNVTDIDD